MTPISSPWLLCSIKISCSQSGEKYASNPLSPNVSRKHVFWLLRDVRRSICTVHIYSFSSLYPAVLWRILIVVVDLQSGAWAARAAKWDRDFYIAIFESDPTHRLLLQGMFLPEDEFSRRAAGRQADTKENRNQRAGGKGKKDRKRQDGMFVRLLNTLQNYYSCQTRLFFYFHINIWVK